MIKLLDALAFIGLIVGISGISASREIYYIISFSVCSGYFFAKYLSFGRRLKALEKK